MTHIRLFEHPANRAIFGGRAMKITGTLPDGGPGLVYEGRLQIVNNIGDCTAWKVSGDLPPGSTVTVDNATYEIVVAWPAYEASAVVIPNAGLEDGNDLGWIKGPGWSVTTDNPITGTYAFQFHQQGGDSYLQSAMRGNITPGTSITASCNVRQGASSKGNAGAGIRLWFYDAAGVELSNPEGNFIAQGSNNAIAVSSITTTAPAGAATVSIGARGSRKRQNKKVWVDDFAWNLQQPSVGTNDEGLWCITLRARDTAAREADWYGCVNVVDVPDTLTYAVATISGGSAAFSTGRFGYRFTVGASALAVKSLRVWSNGFGGAAEQDIRIHRWSDGVLMTTALVDYPGVAAGWAEALAPNVTLAAGETYVISMRGTAGVGATGNVQNTANTYNGITYLDSRIGTGDTMPTTEPGNAYRNMDFGFL